MISLPWMNRCLFNIRCRMKVVLHISHEGWCSPLWFCKINLHTYCCKKG
jgi:hypothetical protein